jgi:hypothetical protein
LLVCLPALLVLSSLGQPPKDKRYLDPLNVKVPAVATDRSVELDYPIVYVRAPPFGDTRGSRWPEVGHHTWTPGPT